MILLVQLFEPLHVVGFHPAVLVPPAVQRRLRDAELLAHVGPVDSRGQLDVGLTQLANDLLGRMTLALHRGSSCPCGRLEPSYHMDQKMGSRTNATVRCKEWYFNAEKWRFQNSTSPAARKRLAGNCSVPFTSSQATEG